MSKATVAQCLMAIKELALKEQQHHEKTLEKITALETDLIQHQSEILNTKKMIENSRQEVVNLKSSYNFFENSFEEFKTTILEKTNAVFTGLEEMKQKTTLEKDAFKNHEDGTRLRKRPRKSTDDPASKRRQNDSPILYKYIHRRINLQLENDKK